MLKPEEIEQAYQRIAPVIVHTPLTLNLNLSGTLKASVFLKREDLQVVRSYKIRGAYNKMVSLSDRERNKGIVCASAGNHAQGVAYACHELGIPGKIYMPYTTPKQKVRSVKMFGKEQVEVLLSGDNFDDSSRKAMIDCQQNQKTFIHPFDDPLVIAGQGTVGMEIDQDLDDIDYIFVPVGGGGLISGVGSYFKSRHPNTRIIGVEPAGAPAMKRSLEQNQLISLDRIDKFVDGAAVQKVGENNFRIGRQVIDEMVEVDEGKVCTTILKLYNEEAIVVEPAGALTIAALDLYREKIRNKKVVCIISGGNNDIVRMEEIKERSLIYEGLKHYFLVIFPQRAGALKEFLVNVLGPDDDITRFEYTKKNNRETGPALVGVELKQKEDYDALIKRMIKYKINYQEINENPELFNLLV
ncbi:MAG: threonine ammonia-lyase [Candidatus Cyclobacteriaceae bacterium M3_2C_046]